MDNRRSRLPLYHLSSEQVDREIERLNAAITAAMAELESIRKLAAPRLGERHLYILDVGILLLGDDMLIGEAQKQIQSNRTNAEWAIQAAIDHFSRIFEEIDDPYLRIGVSTSPMRASGYCATWQWRKAGRKRKLQRNPQLSWPMT